uniref:Multidrug and toxin extrusion protein n=2 Tax=Hyaloperonospora arabidopsidis (strain Emoy2) TaxID=559515 RepID=M4BMT0_HYAAE
MTDNNSEHLSLLHSDTNKIHNNTYCYTINDNDFTTTTNHNNANDEDDDGCDVVISDLTLATITRGSSFVAATCRSPSATSLDGIKLRDDDLDDDASAVSLLRDSLHSSSLSLFQDGDEAEPVIVDEFWQSMALAYPVVVTYTLEYLPGVVGIILVGHIDSPDTKRFVAAATLSTMFTNVSSLSIGFGLTSALDTLCSQAYGAGKLDKLGLYFQAALFVIGACLVPVFILNWHAELFLKWSGQDPEVARLAGEFSRVTVFGVPFLFLYEIARKVLQAQNIVQPMVLFALAGTFINVFGGYMLTYWTPLGFHGAALSKTMGYMVLPLCLVPYFIISGNHTRWWSGWQLQKAKALVPLFLRLGLPGLAMMVLEWWAYELLAVMAGNLPDGVVAVSTHAVLMNVASMIFMVFMGISVSSNIRVGNCLGANCPKKAKMISYITLATVFVLSCFFAGLLYVLRHQIPLIVINDPVAVERASNAILVLMPYEVIDSLNCAIQGIYKGAGWQNMAAKTNAVAFYGIGIPLGALLSFHYGVGIEGLWIGFGTGVATALTVCGTNLYYASWEQMALEARARLAH